MWRERESGLGRGGSHAKRQHRIALWSCIAGKDDLAVLLDRSRGQRLAFPGMPVSRRAQQPASGPCHEGLLDATPGHVGGVRHGATDVTHTAQQGVRVEEAEVGRHRILLLQLEPVDRASGHDVQCVTNVEQSIAGMIEPGGVRVIGHPRGGDRSQRKDVAQPAARFLEIGFEEEGELALPVPAFAACLQQLGQPLARGPSPVRQHRPP